MRMLLCLKIVDVVMKVTTPGPAAPPAPGPATAGAALRRTLILPVKAVLGW